MTNIELVEYAKEVLALGERAVYVYGSFGNKLTTSFCTQKYKQYPSINTAARTEAYKRLCDGKHYGFDCVGLIKSFYWGGYGKTKYNASTDVSANGMYQKAKVKGNISTMDKSRVGLLVQMDGHIGIYIGNNEVIESTISTQFARYSHGLGGICKTKLSDRKWLHWLECPYIDYVKQPVETVKKSVDELADECIKGLWGNGSERRRRLTEAGYSYTEVQARVNQKIYGPKPQTKNIDEIAWAVIRGDYGNGSERRRRLEAAGYNYRQVQNRVNELL